MPAAIEGQGVTLARSIIAQDDLDAAGNEIKRSFR
jgi:hypothetical protein